MARRPAVAPDPALADLLGSWLLALRAEHKSPATVKVYGDGVRRFLAWSASTGAPPRLDRATVSAFMAALLDAGAEPATARSRHLALRRFAAWLVDEGELPTDPLLSSRPPKLDQKVIPELTGDEVRRMLAACAGPAMWDRRDEALVRLMTETGMRAGEAVALKVADVDLRRGLVLVVRGKGGKGRYVPIGPQTVRAIDRYTRARKAHRLADSPALWLGDRGKTFTYDGAAQDPERPGRPGRYRRLPPARAAPHLRGAVAGRRWQ